MITVTNKTSNFPGLPAGTFIYQCSDGTESKYIGLKATRRKGENSVCIIIDCYARDQDGNLVKLPLMQGKHTFMYGEAPASPQEMLQSVLEEEARRGFLAWQQSTAADALDLPEE